MNGELEDILYRLFLLLIDLLAVLGRGLLYSIALNVCAVTVALHIWMATISLKHIAIEHRHIAYLELAARCLQPCFSQTFWKGKRNRGNKEQTCAQCPRIE